MGGCFGNHWVDKHLENELFRHLESEEEEFECNVCGKPIEKEGLCESKKCLEAEQM